MKNIGSGEPSFADLRENGMPYVDKTLLIADILGSNDCGIFLYTRPRGFGKTLNLSMLDAFFNEDYEDNTWFDGLAISEHPEFKEFKNGFPVVHLNLKSTASPDFDGFQSALAGVVLDAFRKHPEVMDSPELMADERHLIDALNSGTATYEQVKTSARKLTEILERIRGSKVVVLIDDYDRAVSDSCWKEDQQQVVCLLGAFLNAVLKGNGSLQMACVAGVMQFSELSRDLDNAVDGDVLQEWGAERFGFTADEVKELLSRHGRPEKYSEIRKRYGGYRFGRSEMFDPSGVMRYVSDDFQPDPFGTRAPDEDTIGRLLDGMSMDTYADLRSLVAGESIETELRSIVPCGDSPLSKTSVFSLLAMSGYLRTVRIRRGVFRVSVPNEKIRGIMCSMMETSARPGTPVPTRPSWKEIPGARSKSPTTSLQDRRTRAIP